MVRITMVYLLLSANTIHGSNNHGVSVVFCYLVQNVGTTTIIDSRYAERCSIASNNCHFDPRHSTVFNPPLILNGKSRHCYSVYKYIRCSVAFEM